LKLAYRFHNTLPNKRTLCRVGMHRFPKPIEFMPLQLFERGQPQIKRGTRLFSEGGIRSSPNVSFPGGIVPRIGAGPLPGPSTFSETQNLNWFGTARLRLGVTSGPALFYVTGGLIYGHEGVSFSDAFPTAGVTYAASGGSTRAGGTVGGGVEYLFNSALSGKIEGLYYDMGSQTLAFTTGFTTAETYRYRGAIVRAGLDWKLGTALGAAPVVTK
jgi:opacity protein-like surface antigen